MSNDEPHDQRVLAQPLARDERWIALAHHVLTRVPAARSPLVLFDRTVLTAQVELWRAHMPRVEPHFAIKTCNALPVLAHFDRLGMAFDAATAGEIRLLERLGVSPSRVICTHPVRDEEDVEAIARYRPRALVVEDAAELRKLQRAGIPGPGYAPEIILRVELPFGGLSGKFGAEIASLRQGGDGQLGWQVRSRPARAVFEEAAAIERESGCRYAGFGLSSHVGTNTCATEKYEVMLRVFAHLRRELLPRGIAITTFNLGGGYCDPEHAEQQGTTQQAFLAALGRCIERVAAENPGVRLIAEPGRFMVSNAAAVVIGVMKSDERRLLPMAEGEYHEVAHLKVQMNDGLYGNLLGERHDDKLWRFLPLRTDPEAGPLSGETLPAILNGKTCDSWDRLARMRPLPRNLAAGDALVVPNAGAYTIVTATDFNSAPRSQLCLCERRPDGSYDCTVHGADGGVLTAPPAAGRPIARPAPRPVDLADSAEASQAFTLSGVVGSLAEHVDGGLIRPRAYVGGARWSGILSLLAKNEAALSLANIRPIAESSTTWLLLATAAEARTIFLKVGREPLAGARVDAFRSAAARVAALGGDPRVPRVEAYGVLPDGGNPYVAMEFVPGQSLEALLPLFHSAAAAESKDWRGGDRRAALEHVRQVALGLQQAHAACVLHRQLDVAHVLVPDDRRLPVQLLGWGLFGAGPRADADPAAGRGADVRALGVLLHHVLFNRAIEEGNGTGAAARPVQTTSRPPRGLEAIVQRALADDAAARFPSAAAVADELGRYLGVEGLAPDEERAAGSKWAQISAVFRRRPRDD